MELIKDYLPILIPYIIAELALAITALVHVLKHSNYRFGNKTMWIFIVLIFQIIGPIAYFTFGRGEDE